MKKVKDFNHTLASLPKDDSDVLNYEKLIKAGISGHILAYAKLVIITKAINDKWIPDYNNSSERKYELWLEIIADEKNPSGSGLAAADVVSWYTHTFVGSRLCFVSREAAKYAFETFKSDYKDYILIKN